MPVKDPIVEAHDLSAGYRRLRVLDHLDLALGPGCHVVLGANGAGKTTLFRALSGVLTPWTGEVRILGRDPFREVEVKTAVGISSHRAPLAPRLSVLDNLHYWARVAGLSSDTISGQMAEVLAVCDLEPLTHRLAVGLSRGQAQRVSLARAMLGNPAILLLDEPFVGIDPGHLQPLRAYLRHLADEGRTLLISTHDLAEAEALHDDVVLLRQGRVMAQGLLDDLRPWWTPGAYEIRIRGHGEMADVVERLGYIPTRKQPGMIEIAVPNPQSTARIVSELVAAGVEVYEVTPTVSRLDGLYADGVELQKG